MFTDEEKKILERYFTNTDQSIFAIKNLPEVIKGTLFSRYSRTTKSVRRLFLDEFVNADVLKDYFLDAPKADEGVNTGRAEDFYERILVGYGDDSVAELGGCHVALEGVSMIAAKTIEEHRLGMSPLEKSTRYVYFDQKVNGEYQYLREKNIMASKHRELYLEVNNLLFDTYSKIVRDIQPILKEIFPGDEKETAYAFSIRAKACDLARGLLPLSTFTNMGAFANGRAHEYVLLNLLNEPLEEMKDIARQLDENLKKVIPAFIKRATNERGDAYRTYLQDTERSLELGELEESLTPVHGPSVKLVDCDEHAIERIIAAILYGRSNMDYEAARAKAGAMNEAEKEKIFSRYLSSRKNRHHKPGRALEEAYFSFDIISDWGAYKDLQRHRILTRYRQLFTTELGYWTPNEIEMTGFASFTKKQWIVRPKRIRSSKKNSRTKRNTLLRTDSIIAFT